MRLTNAMRETIRNRVIAHRFTADAHALFCDYGRLAARAYDFFYPAPMRTRMDSLPKGWLPEDDDIRFQCGNTYARFSFDGTPYRSDYLGNYTKDIEPISKRFLTKDKGACLFVLEADHSISVELEQLNQRRTGLIEAEHQAIVAIRTTLEKFHTSEKLIEGWPEVEPFMDGIVPVKAAPLVVQTADLNALLDLPVRETV